MFSKNKYSLFYVTFGRFFKVGIFLLLFTNCGTIIEQKAVKNKVLEPEKRFIFIRHGITPWDWRMLAKGPQDLALSPEGEEHVSQLSKFLKNRGVFPTQIISSKLKRCIQTSTILKDVMKNSSSITTLKDLNEIYYGDFSQKKAASEEIVREYDEKVRKNEMTEEEARRNVLQKIQLLPAPSDAEPWAEFKKRIEPTLDGILKIEENNTFIISHGMVIKEYLKSRGFGLIAESWAKQGNDRGAVIVTCSLDGKIKKVEVINYK